MRTTDTPIPAQLTVVAWPDLVPSASTRPCWPSHDDERLGRRPQPLRQGA